VEYIPASNLFSLDGNGKEGYKLFFSAFEFCKKKIRCHKKKKKKKKKKHWKKCN
jgi:hypothetical protein